MPANSVRSRQSSIFFTLFAEQAVVVFFVLSGLLVGGVIVRGAREGSFTLR